MMNPANIMGDNNNKFYVVQQLKKKNNNKKQQLCLDYFYIRCGRMGQKNQQNNFQKMKNKKKSKVRQKSVKGEYRFGKVLQLRGSKSIREIGKTRRKVE
ncbi:unnamed protein product [Paramecium sonneborni]|uniref:Uncharacterized protein n=1 Tax=Paramecium sonneborni TaxID=65129 RepID=A0A8S1RJW1_9CILI|nr:unnamed protein product [Paramecium sonneborni]